MIGPTKKPQDFGFKEGDTHLVVNDASETMKAYDFKGTLLWEIPCLARGQGSDFEFKLTNTDTPPGLYKIGAIYKDYEKNSNPPFDRTLMAYGWYSFDLEELENQEAKYGRGGIMIHGGGSAAGWPGAWASKQPLFATHGCIRTYNIDLRDKILPLTKKGTVFVSVYQEAPPGVSYTPIAAPKTNTATTKIPQQALDLIKEFEGFEAKAYYDPLSGGLPITIGYGSTRRRDGSRFMIGNVISQKEAEDLLSYQLETDYLPSLQKIPYWNEMNDNQRSALLSFAYNLGANFYGSAGFNTITQRLKNKEWSKVPDALMLYVNPGTNVEAGLRRRRAAESKLWST
jgi:GH24 family phage-related lysozyme (muramidase)